MLRTCAILTCIQFGVWFLSAGVFTCSAGQHGMFVERYTRWALCSLASLTILTFAILLGVGLASTPNAEWPAMVVYNIKNLFVTDYQDVEEQTRVLRVYHNKKEWAEATPLAMLLDKETDVPWTPAPG